MEYLRSMEVIILDKDEKDIEERLLEVIENADKVAEEMAKIVTRILSYCSLMLIVLLIVVVVALIF